MYVLEQPDPHTVPYYHLGVITFAASTVIKILAEPVRMASQIMLYARLRVCALLINSDIVTLVKNTVSSCYYVLHCRLD